MKPSKPAYPEDIRRAVQTLKRRGHVTSIRPGLRGKIVGALNAEFGQYAPDGNNITEANRRLVQGWLCLPPHEVLREYSIKEAEPAEIQALGRWAGIIDAFRPEFTIEAIWVLERAQRCMELSNDLQRAGEPQPHLADLILATSQDLPNGQIVRILPGGVLDELQSLGAELRKSAVMSTTVDDDVIY